GVGRAGRREPRGGKGGGWGAGTALGPSRAAQRGKCQNGRTCRSSSGCSTACADERGCHEVGVRIRRSVSVPNAIPQEGNRGMPKAKTRWEQVASTEQPREGPS